MPYIKQERREELIPLGLDPSAVPKTPGELNYMLTEVALEYVRANHLSYQTINDVMGAFHCAAAEFYRRVAVQYENAKITENGDLPGFRIGEPAPTPHAAKVAYVGDGQAKAATRKFLKSDDEPGPGLYFQGDLEEIKRAGIETDKWLAEQRNRED